MRTSKWFLFCFGTVPFQNTTDLFDSIARRNVFFFILHSRQLKEVCQQEDETAGKTQPESARRVPPRLPGRDQTEESV